MLLHSLSTVNIAYSAVLHGIDLQTETHITGSGSKVKRNYHFKVNILSYLGHKRDRVTMKWRKLHNEERDDLHSLPNIVRVINREGLGERGM